MKSSLLVDRRLEFAGGGLGRRWAALALACALCGGAFAQGPTFGFASGMGGTGNDFGKFIAVDGSGNVYTTGFFEGAADFDPGAGTATLTSAGGRDIFLSKLDASGNFVWAKAFGGAGEDSGYSIAIDGSGDVYTTGIFQGAVDFDPGAGTATLASAGSYDAFISRLDASGNFVWAQRIGGTGVDSGWSLALDSSGNVYCSGYFQGTVDFDPGAGTANLSSVGLYDIFVSKLSSSGNYVLAKQMTGGGSPQNNSIAVDGAQNIYIAGMGAVGASAYKLNASGSLLWTKEIGSGADTQAPSIAVDGSGNVCITGYFDGFADFDPGAASAYFLSSGGYDVFVLKLNPSGNFLWARQWGGAGADSGYAIALDGSGNIYITGIFAGTVDFDPGAGMFNLSGQAGGACFVSTLDASGGFLWAAPFGGSVGYCAGNSIALDVLGGVYTAGAFVGTADFDPGVGTGNLMSTGGTDIFVSKLGVAMTLPAAHTKALLLTALLIALCIGFAVRRSRKQAAS